MLPGVPTVFTAGESYAPVGSFGAMVPDWPAQNQVFWDDFNKFSVVLTTGAADWLLLGTNAAVANTVITDATGGVLSFATAAADADQAFAQWHGGNPAADIAEIVKFTPGKELWFATRFQLSDVVDEAFQIGLVVAAANPSTAADGVFFNKADLSSTLTLQSKIATPVTASANLFTLAAATWYEVGFHYNGVDTIRAFRRDTGADGTWSSVGSVGITALPTTELAPTITLINGSAGAKTALIDYFFMSVER